MSLKMVYLDVKMSVSFVYKCDMYKKEGRTNCQGKRAIGLA